jgi:hypothetical protein
MQSAGSLDWSLFVAASLYAPGSKRNPLSNEERIRTGLHVGNTTLRKRFRGLVFALFGLILTLHPLHLLGK